MNTVKTFKKSFKFLIRNYNIVLIFVIAVLQAFPTCGQSEDKLGSWYIYNGFFNFTPKYQLFFETQLRTYEVISDPETFFLRPYFNYNFNRNFQLGLGLEYHANWTYEELAEDRVKTEEFRTTLQSMIFHSIDRVNMQHRYRYEFRNVDGSNRQRTRYRVQATTPINKKKMDPGAWFFNVFNEFLIDTNPELAMSQNRFYFAGGYQFNKSLNFQLGYLIISRPTTTHHRLQFFLTHKLFFYEKE